MSVGGLIARQEAVSLCCQGVDRLNTVPPLESLTTLLSTMSAVPSSLLSSLDMERNCSKAIGDEREVNFFAALGLDLEDVHTAFAKDPAMVALNAFLDFLSLVDAKAIVHTGSIVVLDHGVQDEGVHEKRDGARRQEVDTDLLS